MIIIVKFDFSLGGIVQEVCISYNSNEDTGFLIVWMCCLCFSKFNFIIPQIFVTNFDFSYHALNFWTVSTSFKSQADVGSSKDCEL